MKKILSIISATIMLFCSISILAGCNSKDSSNSNSKSEVVLDKVSAAAYTETAIQTQSISIFNMSENSINGMSDNNEEKNSNAPIDAPSDYTFILKSQLEINFDIKLSNPKNYYIMDFKLTCDEEQIEYYDEKMEKWTPINDVWIRWSGSNNQESRYRLKLPTPEISPDKIKISEMYYSDRTDGTNKTAVNMNNKETYTVYKVEDNLLTTETVSNSREKYVFRINKMEGVEILNVTENGVDLTSADGNYEVTSNGKIVIEYQKNIDNVIYKGKYEKDIELVSLVATEMGGMFGIQYVFGTDVDKFNVIIEYVFKEQFGGGIDYDLKDTTDLESYGIRNTYRLQRVRVMFAENIEYDSDGFIISFTIDQIIETFDIPERYPDRQ